MTEKAPLNDYRSINSLAISEYTAIANDRNNWKSNNTYDKHAIDNDSNN